MLKPLDIRMLQVCHSFQFTLDSQLINRDFKIIVGKVASVEQKQVVPGNGSSYVNSQREQAGFRSHPRACGVAQGFMWASLSTPMPEKAVQLVLGDTLPRLHWTRADHVTRKQDKRRREQTHPSLKGKKRCSRNTAP